MKAPITAAQAMSHPDVATIINSLGRIADELRTERDELVSENKVLLEDAARIDFMASCCEWDGYGMWTAEHFLGESEKTITGDDLRKCLDDGMKYEITKKATNG